MKISEIKSGLHSRLTSRRIHYDLYTFDATSAVVIAYLQGPKGSLSRPYLITGNEDGTIEVTTHDNISEVRSEGTAISMVVRDLKSQIAKFKKYLN